MADTPAASGMSSYAPAMLTMFSAVTGAGANSVAYNGQKQSAQMGVQTAQYMQQQYEANANSEEAAGQRADLDVIRTGQYLASKFQAGAAGSGTYGPDMAAARARIISEAAYQGAQKQWGYEQAARTARMQGEAGVWTAENKSSQVDQAGTAVGISNMGLMAKAGASMYSRYNVNSQTSVT